jgi:eukaryotic-like serine/threonine-protein kinase
VTLDPGARLGRYDVVALVAANERAEVYRAVDTTLQREVALKLFAGAGPRDRREADAVARLAHPNIVATYEVLESNGRLCLVRQWVDGGGLDALLARRHVLTTDETLRLAHDVASALEHAHGAGILHRDVTPSNVLIDRDGRFLLVDFGALGRLEAATGTTASGEIAGTPIYMSPEQALGSRQSPATDIFGLGLVLFRCTFGYVPGEGSDNLVDLLRGRLSGSIEVPPSPLRELIVHCVALDAAQRYQSATELLAHVRRLQLASMPGAPSAPGAPVAPPDAPGAAPVAHHRSRAAPVAMLAAIGLVAAVAIVVAALLIGDGASLGLSSDGAARGDAARVVLGAALAIAAIVLARTLRRRWSARSPETERRAASILFGAESRADLTRSLVIEVDHLVSALSGLDRKLLGMTVVAMIHEYETSRESADRQSALLNVVTLMEKIQTRLAPWHVRHRDAITTGVAVVGCLTGIVSALSAFAS